MAARLSQREYKELQKLVVVLKQKRRLSDVQLLLLKLAEEPDWSEDEVKKLRLLLKAQKACSSR